MSDAPLSNDGDEVLVRCAAVLFDCDGVLVDSDAAVLDAWTRWAEEFDLDAESVLGIVHGRRAGDTVAALIAEEHRERAKQAIDDYELESADSVRAIPGAGELLRSMPADSWAVVTSGTRALARARLVAAGLPEPKVLVSADDVSRGKPDPEGYRSAASALGAPTGDTVVLEDALAGIEAARAAGVAAVIGVGDRGLRDAADHLVADLSTVRWAGAGLTIRPVPAF